MSTFGRLVALCSLALYVLERPLPFAVPRQAEAQARQLEDTRAAEVLESELEKFAGDFLPSKEQQVKKLQICQELQEICRCVLGEEAQLSPFGSSANDCGERSGDLDVVIGGAKLGKRKILGLVQEACKLCGFQVVELRAAKVPILMLRKDSVDIDLSYGSILPILNTRL